MTPLRRAAPLAAVALLAAPAPASADATITALPRDRFEPAELTIDAGERVTFANRDVAVHDVVGSGFRSARTDPGRDAPVEGAERLAPGRYAFVCSLHSHMTGALIVRGDPPSPPPDTTPQPPPDTTAPSLSVRIRGRVVRVTVDEAATVVVRAAGRTRTRTRRTAGPATLRFRFRARPRRVTVTASDAAGNRRTVVRRTRPRR